MSHYLFAVKLAFAGMVCWGVLLFATCVSYGDSMDIVGLSRASTLTFGEIRYSERGMSACYQAGSFGLKNILKILASATPTNEIPFSQTFCRGILKVGATDYFISFPQWKYSSDHYVFTICSPHQPKQKFYYRLPRDKGEIVHATVQSLTHTSPAPLQ